jgi:hypothetical protein
MNDGDYGIWFYQELEYGGRETGSGRSLPGKIDDWILWEAMEERARHGE